MKGKSIWAFAVVGVLLIAFAGGCKRNEKKLLKKLQGQWTTSDVKGLKEQVLFTRKEIVFKYKTKKQYKCPYRVFSYDDKSREIEIQTRCRRRTGSLSMVPYKIIFNKTPNTFVLQLEGRNVGVFTSGS